MKTNRREGKAVRSGKYAKAQWYQIDQLRRLAYRNCNALAYHIIMGGRNPLCVEYRGLP